ncbi:hypothetical protein HIM_04022 [Hirsutella minnesotensis 3608]|uniref:Uncharacterized protein n=1 Tax=Hirsutella minnesotensis 3608 TaxID=1043627 RepID=A0A0F7ZLU5_9HYPO|nr:hypothetical protein HIM_04022 [Hirsutella minnesotensis 3608]
MAIFFVGWELWQDMTFVLGCCIILVFLIGVIRLWWSNRKLRKHEIIEEERRARLAEMRQCGIESLRANEIPFGVRALESGVEVEGIWISRSNTPDGYHTASSATTPMDEPLGRKGKGRMVDPRRVELSIPAANDYLAAPSPRHGAGRILSPLASSSETAYVPLAADEAFEEVQLHTYRPPTTAGAPRTTRAWPLSSSSNDSSLRYSDAQQHLLAGPSPQIRSGGVSRDPAPYGAAEVYANRLTRKPNKGFEVLPAGVLGPRQEFRQYGEADEEEAGEGMMPSQRQGQPSRLQKRTRT